MRNAPSLPSHFGPALQRYDPLDGYDGFQEYWLAIRFGAFGFRKLIAVGLGSGHHDFSDDQSACEELSNVLPELLALEHPNITRVDEWGAHQGRIYQANEFCPGVALSSLMPLCRQKGRLLPRAFAIWIVQKLCETADYYHRVQRRTSRHNFLHSFTSSHRFPSQVMISFHGEVKQLGLQSALLWRHLRRQRVTFDSYPHPPGHFSYISPEEILGIQSDARSSVFSLGTLLYTLTTGHQPFHRERPFEELLALKNCQVPAPMHLDPRFCPVLQRVIQKAMLKNPQSRYPSAAEMALTLAEYLKRGRAEASTAHLRRFVRACFPARWLEAKRLQRRFLPQENTVSDTTPTVELLAPASAPR